MSGPLPWRIVSYFGLPYMDEYNDSALMPAGTFRRLMSETDFDGQGKFSSMRVER